MKYDLDKMSRAELEQLRKDVETALSTLAERERHAAIEAAEQAAKAHGFSLKQLTGVEPLRGKSKGKPKNPPRYRNPENPSVTWTGRGRKPQWIKDAESKGVDISDFAI
jgi:DNA-binding protein H-NS